MPVGGKDEFDNNPAYYEITTTDTLAACQDLLLTAQFGQLGIFRVSVLVPRNRVWWKSLRALDSHRRDRRIGGIEWSDVSAPFAICFDGCYG